MTSIAKNIKRLRGERKLTQEQLAEALCVTRQTVSSWENNRTQPDIDMLTALSDALGADVEELIYGKRRSVGLETAENDGAEKKHLSAVVLAVFGSLLLAAGAIILLVWLWRDMPELARGVLSFLPGALGLGCDLWAVFTKKPGQLKSEAAAVLWIAGFCATVALVNDSFGVDLDFNRLLLADTLLILPVMFALDSAAAFTALNGFGMVFTVRFGEAERPAMLAFAALFFAAAALFVWKNGLPAPLKTAVRWVLTGTGVFYAATVVRYALPQSYAFTAAMLTGCACMTALLAADREHDGTLPLRYPAAAGMVLLTFIALFFEAGFIPEQSSAYNRPAPAGAVVGCYAAALALAAAGIVYGRASLRRNPLKLLFLCACLGTALSLLTENRLPKVLVIAALGVILILRGVKTLKLLPMNFGMAAVAADLIFVIQDRLEQNMPLIGGFCVVLGAAILLINRKMLSAKREKAAVKEAENDA